MLDRVEIRERFRLRLLRAMEEAGLNRSQLARQVGIDRSTLSQILGHQAGRLPRADTAAAMASVLQVSLDWLLGLTEQHSGVQGAGIVELSPEIEPGDPAAADVLLSRWHTEAAGFKIRYVPSTLPDLLKTDEVIDYEFARMPRERTEEVRVRAAQRLAYSRAPETDVEVCSSLQSVQALINGEGIWADLPMAARVRQIEQMRSLVDELYPTFRWFLFDGAALYSVPITVFGPRRAAIYVGQRYFVFNTTEHIQTLMQHFDELIRAANVQPTDIAGFLAGELERLRDAAAA
ncbi:MAG: helix-turn-helix transcriptional regulator [Alphaproteobacteria bacterium]|jgi:transcriptional regulator with XRE-family HTH domain|nr:helix-turn-helix transcriptional regulator [Alphaproteobacteria bacterium]MDP6567037.1 helix-turn-helix transcriptional regulator [Alphaproteobacteria bacterium]MDP6812457.1 helix-turn-helix transcriptional regulator [Alphaproteobacteria bacterium]